MSIISSIMAVVLFSASFFAFAQAQGAKKSEVRIINNIPRLFISGEEINTGAVNVYYLPDMGIDTQGKNEVPRYGTEEWFTNTKALIDQAVNNNARLILLNVWWQDFDTSRSRPKDIAGSLDFKQLDEVFNYAQHKGTYLIPVFVFFPFIPDWWLKENNFPPYHKDKICDLCETDSYGNRYNNSSMNADKVQQDWGLFIEAMVKRYRSHPALAGWLIGVGATGEDGYGPNYIYLRGFGNSPERIEPRPLMFTDYSPYFERKFKEWLKGKYSSNAELQKAWNDKTINLDSFKVPPPSEMIRQGQQVHFFPDPTDIFASAHGDNEENKLTAKGRDFYEFRNYMRRQDRRYYATLFKKLDPEHILILSAASNDALSDESLADGIAFSLAGTIDWGENSLFYYLALDIVKNAVHHNKLAFISREHVCDGALRLKTGQCETLEQLRFMENLGKSVRCAGGIFAYTTAPYSEESFTNRSWVPPVWFSSQAMNAAKKINEYSPSEDCACSFISEIYSHNSCDRPELAGVVKNCELLNKIYESYCNARLMERTIGKDTGITGTCGDGICDSFEKQCGKCPGDCL